MGRPQKNNADYFSHDNDMRNDEKIKAVRRKFKHIGYSVWNMLLEKLCKAGDFTLQYNDTNIELWAGDFEVEPEMLKEILEYFLKVDLLLFHDGMIFSETMINRFNPLLCKRKRQKEWLSTTKTTEKEVIDVDNAHSKVKDSKVNNSNKDLKTQCHEFVKVYGQEMINKFLNYWQEKNSKGVEKWKLQKTWETKRRLETWKKNDFGYKKPVQKSNAINGAIV